MCNPSVLCRTYSTTFFGARKLRVVGMGLDNLLYDSWVTQSDSSRAANFPFVSRPKFQHPFSQSPWINVQPHSNFLAQEVVHSHNTVDSITSPFPRWCRWCTCRWRRRWIQTGCVFAQGPHQLILSIAHEELRFTRARVGLDLEQPFQWLRGFVEIGEPIRTPILKVIANNIRM
jgi:hypothetical protein